ncbi:MAG: acyl carrier protein [Lachnospiraceae bacterium]
MFEEIKNLMVENLGLEADEIKEETEFKKDLNIDSLDLFELVSQVEEIYGIEIAAEDLESIVSVKDLVSYIEKKK